MVAHVVSAGSVACGLHYLLGLDPTDNEPYGFGMSTLGSKRDCPVCARILMHRNESYSVVGDCPAEVRVNR